MQPPPRDGRIMQTAHNPVTHRPWTTRCGRP